MEDMCTLSVPPPSYAEVQEKERRHRVVKRVVFCCVMVVVALVVGWCIPGPAYIRTRTNTREVYVTQTKSLEVWITRTKWISPTRSSKCTTITRTPSPTGKPVCPYTYPAGYKDGKGGGSYGDWSPRIEFKSDQGYMKGYFEGFYNYRPYCVSNQLSS